MLGVAVLQDERIVSKAYPAVLVATTMTYRMEGHLLADRYL